MPCDSGKVSCFHWRSPSNLHRSIASLRGLWKRLLWPGIIPRSHNRPSFWAKIELSEGSRSPNRGRCASVYRPARPIPSFVPCQWHILPDSSILLPCIRLPSIAVCFFHHIMQLPGRTFLSLFARRIIQEKTSSRHKCPMSSFQSVSWYSISQHRRMPMLGQRSNCGVPAERLVPGAKVSLDPAERGVAEGTSPASTLQSYMFESALGS